MPRRYSGCVSINGALYQRFQAECERQGVPMQVMTDALMLDKAGAR